MRFYPKRTAYLLFCALFLLSFVLSGGSRSLVAIADGQEKNPLVIIDAGHGGQDSGAVGAGGALEKDLNFTIAKKLASLFHMAGIPVLLTRTEDALVLKEGEDIKGHRKEKDLYNRAALAAAYPDAVFVSIHMNSYPVSKYRGFEVYYSTKNAQSARLAARITQQVREELDPVYTREPRAAGDNIYLLSHMSNVSVLVECGFLSCPEEEAKLLTEDYQNKLCFCIFCAIMEERT